MGTTHVIAVANRTCGTCGTIDPQYICIAGRPTPTPTPTQAVSETPTPTQTQTFSSNNSQIRTFTKDTLANGIKQKFIGVHGNQSLELYLLVICI